jgi:small subunit ribosomal protein S6
LNTYETIFITTPNLSEDEEKSTVEALQTVITDRGGEVFITERMGRRRLGYPIRKFDDGVYTRFLYDSDTDVPKELERRMRLSDRVLRALTVRMEREWAADSKEQAVRIIERIAEDAVRAKEEAAEAERKAAEEAAEAERKAAEAPEEASAGADGESGATDEPAGDEPADAPAGEATVVAETGESEDK